MTETNMMITDEQELVSVTNQWGREQKIYDDGFGPLWVYRESLGVMGIVRAQSYESAWDCVLDEILAPVPSDEITESPDDFYVCERDYHCGAPKNYSEGKCLCSLAEHSEFRECWRCRQQPHRARIEGDWDHEYLGCTERKALANEVYLGLAEGYEYQPNSGGTSGIVGTDLNGNALDVLTKDLAEHLELTVVVRCSDCEKVECECEDQAHHDDGYDGANRLG